MKKIPHKLSPRTRAVLAAAQVFVLALGVLLPLLLNKADAAQITSRSLSISSAKPSASSVQYTFTFTVPSTVQVQGLKLQTCTTAVGTCSGTAGTTVPDFSSRTF